MKVSAVENRAAFIPGLPGFLSNLVGFIDRHFPGLHRLLHLFVRVFQDGAGPLYFAGRYAYDFGGFLGGFADSAIWRFRLKFTLSLIAFAPNHMI